MFQFHYFPLLSDFSLWSLFFSNSVSSSLVISRMTSHFYDGFFFFFSTYFLFPRSNTLVFISFCEIYLFCMHLDLCFELFFSGDIFINFWVLANIFGQDSHFCVCILIMYVFSFCHFPCLFFSSFLHAVFFFNGTPPHLPHPASLNNEFLDFSIIVFKLNIIKCRLFRCLSPPLTSIRWSFLATPVSPSRSRLGTVF